MAAKIKVNTGSLDQTRKEIEGRLAQAKRSIEEIWQAMSALNSMWEGDAHAVFAKEVSEDIQQLQNMCDGIQEIIRYEGNAVTEYNKCEQQVGEIISQIRI